MDDAEIDRILYSDGYRIAGDHFVKGITVTGMNEAVRRLYRSVDGLLDSFRSRSAIEGKPVACRRGCHWCCYQAVFAGAHEMHFIREFVKRTFSEEEQEEFRQRSREKAALTLQKTVKELYLVRQACPFLDRGYCRIYEARPMACRIYLSSSVDSCRKEHEDPGNREHIPELFQFPLRAGRMLNEGFVVFLREWGLHVSELPLEQGYSSLVDLGQSMESWIHDSRS